VQADHRGAAFTGDPFRFRLGIQAHRLRLAHSIAPYAALNASRIDPLPHQFEAVYGHLLARPVVRVNFRPSWGQWFSAKMGHSDWPAHTLWVAKRDSQEALMANLRFDRWLKAG